MIDRKQLRIGNLVLSNGTTSIVDRIDQTKQADPMPITEEFLQRFGFKMDDNYNYWTSIVTHYLELIRVRGDYYPIYAEIGELSHQEEQRVSLRSIRYIHELQNLYFTLTGQELELKTE